MHRFNTFLGLADFYKFLDVCFYAYSFVGCFVYSYCLQ